MLTPIHRQVDGVPAAFTNAFVHCELDPMKHRRDVGRHAILPNSLHSPSLKQIKESHTFMYHNGVLIDSNGLGHLITTRSVSDAHQGKECGVLTGSSDPKPKVGSWTSSPRTREVRYAAWFACVPSNSVQTVVRQGLHFLVRSSRLALYVCGDRREIACKSAAVFNSKHHEAPIGIGKNENAKATKRIGL